MKKNVKVSLIVVAVIMGFFSLGWIIGLYSNNINKTSLNIATFMETNEKEYEDTSINAKSDKEDNSNTSKDEETKEAEVDGESIEKPIERKVAYLTFDDGPTTKITPQILDILDNYDIKATFFVIGSLAEVNQDVLKDVDMRGHIIGNHTYSHDYKLIYSSVDALMKDIDKADEVLESILPNYKRGLFRFPMGSFKKWYKHYDWNALNGDAEALNVPANKLISNVKKTVCGKNKVIILMHDAQTKQTTVDSLSRVIDYLLEEGYSFETLNNYK